MTTIDGETFSALRDTTGGDFVRELIDTFLAEAPAMLADLRESLASDQADRFRRAAHSLKSNGNTFGALTLGSLAKELELSGLPQVKQRGPSALAAIEAEYVRVAAELARLRDE
jgi:HPt (histidine-containing phosphotransfer) domain-containing protein